jgi:hypothetical protein
MRQLTDEHGTLLGIPLYTQSGELFTYVYTSAELDAAVFTEEELAEARRAEEEAEREAAEEPVLTLRQVQEMGRRMHELTHTWRWQ